MNDQWLPLTVCVCVCVCLFQAMAMVPLRDTALQDELNKQNSNDTLRAKFATQANTVGAYIQEKMEVKDQSTMSASCWTWCLISKQQDI